MKNISGLIFLMVIVGFLQRCKPEATTNKNLLLAMDTTEQYQFADTIQATDSSLSVIERSLVAIKITPGSDTMLMPKLKTSDFFVVLNSDEGRVNYTPTLKWLRVRNNLVYVPDQLGNVRKMLGKSLSWLAPVYRKVGVEGDAGLFTPKPDVLMIRDEKITIELEKELATLSLEEKPNQSLPGIRYYKIGDTKKFNAYRVRARLLQRSEFKNDPLAVFFVNTPFRLVSQRAPDDLLYSRQAYLNEIGFPDAWDKTGTKPVTVAVIDYGCNVSVGALPDLTFRGGIRLGGGVNSNPGGAPWGYTLDQDHGSEVAAIIGSRRNNTIGMAGIGNNVTIMSLALDDGSDVEVAEGIRSAAVGGAKVINMSIGSNTYDPATLNVATTVAHNRNVFMCASTGSARGGGQIMLPAGSKYVMAIGGCVGRGPDLNACYGDVNSNGRRVGVSVVAPSVSILTLDHNNQEATVSGTSFSCPMVAGIAALMLASNKGLKPDEIQAVLELSAEKIGDPSTYFNVQKYGRALQRNQRFGFGLVNAKAALLAVQRQPN